MLKIGTYGRTVSNTLDPVSAVLAAPCFEQCVKVNDSNELLSSYI